MRGCDVCQKNLQGENSASAVTSAEVTGEAMSPKIKEKDSIIRELELELAQTKLALVESECKVQDLTHELNAAVSEIQVMHDSKTTTWLGNKTHSLLTSLREVTGSSSTSSGNIKKDAATGQSSAASGVNNHGAARRDASGYLSKSQSRESVQRKDSRETS